MNDDLRELILKVIAGRDLEIWLSRPHKLLAGRSPTQAIADGDEREVRRLFERFFAGDTP